MSIINQVVEVLFDNKDPRLAVEELMGRDKNVEFYRSGYDSYKN